MKIQVKAEAVQRNLTRVRVRSPVPCDWREQKVKLVSETKPPGCRSREQTVKTMGVIWSVSCAKIPAGRTLKLQRIYEIERYEVVSRLDPQALKRPGRRTGELRKSLGNSPGIDLTNRKLRKLAETLAAKSSTPWEFVEKAADWVGDNVTYRRGSFRGAGAALEQARGDCEDLSALLIALCRISEIPARTVWVKGHAYPEFYLEDAKNQGYWIPVQLHGPEDFGTIRETRPILQKGDRYRDRVTKKTLRYLPQQVTAFGGRAKLSVTRTISKPEPAD